MTPKRKWRIEWAWLIAVLVVLVLGLYWLPGRARRDDSYSPTPQGKRAFFTLVKHFVSDTDRHEKRLLPPGAGPQALCILGPARYPKPEEWKALHAWVSRGNTLLFAARLRDPVVDLDPFGITVVPARYKSIPGKLKRALGALTADDADDAAAADDDRKTKDATPGSGTPGDITGPGSGSTRGRGASAFSKLKGRAAERKIRTTLVSGKVRWRSAGALNLGLTGAKVLVDSESGVQAATVAVGKGRIIVVATDEIFTNRSFLYGDDGLLAWRLLEQRGGRRPVRFDEYLNVTGTPKVFGMLFESTLRPVTLQLLLVAVLFGWWGSRRFGPARPPGEPPRRSIVEHAEALGNLHYRAGTGSRAVAAYLDWFRGEVRLGGAGNPREQIRQLAFRAGRDPDEVHRLIQEASLVAQQAGTPAARATMIIRELSRLRRQLQRTARGTHAD